MDHPAGGRVDGRWKLRPRNGAWQIASQSQITLRKPWRPQSAQVHHGIFNRSTTCTDLVDVPIAE